MVEEFINRCHIKTGSYDIIKSTQEKVPSYFEMGRIYTRLILKIADSEEKYIDTLISFLSSWIIEKIDNYDSSLYYENVGYLYECYINGKIL